MAERLTVNEPYCGCCEWRTDCMRAGGEKRGCDIVAMYNKLKGYEDLEEQGRMVILPKGMNLRKLLEILDGNISSCPSDYNLINRCELSCFECWLAALKGAEE